MANSRLFASESNGLRSLVLLGLLVFGPGLLGAQAADPVVTLQSLGYTVSVETVEGQREFALQGLGFPISVLEAPQFTEASTAFLSGLIRTIQSLDTIKVSRVKIALKAPESTALVLVNSLTTDGAQLAGNLPEGIFLRYIDSIYYDFSMIVNNLRLRVRGQFFSEDELVAKLGRIYRNPNDYMLSQDSEYVFTYMQSIKAENEALKAELAKLRDGVILSHTRGFFGDWFDFDRAEVAALVEWRTKNPNATQKQAEDWTREQGFKLTWQQIQMVLVTYFNSFR